MTLLPGAMVAEKYRIRRLLGAGGMGAVYLATNVVTQMDVALKVMAEELHANGDAAHRFLQEARAAASIRHPAIVRIYDASEEPGGLWIAMECLEGETLSHRLERGPLSQQELREYVQQLLDALDHVHRAGIVHRDLKPDNLFLEHLHDNRIRLRLLDFGIAKLGTAPLARLATRTGVIMGTPQYLAPEQAKQAKDVDLRADIFSFGVILYECLTGSLPWHGDSLAEILAKVWSEPPRPIAVPAPLQRYASIALACMAIDKARRPANARAIAALLAGGNGQLGLAEVKSNNHDDEGRGARRSFAGFSLWAWCALVAAALMYALLLRTGALDSGGTTTLYLRRGTGGSATTNPGSRPQLSPGLVTIGAGLHHDEDPAGRTPDAARKRSIATSALERWIPAGELTEALLSGSSRHPGGIFEYVDSEGLSHYSNAPTADKNWRRIYSAGPRSGIETPAAERDHSYERYSRYDAFLLEAVELYKLPMALLRAIVHVESDFDANLVSVDGAMGLMQLMPFTAQKMGVEDPFDPRQNILGGSRFLRVLANEWNGDLVLTIASYRAGTDVVEKYRGVPPDRDTRRFVERVLQRYYTYLPETDSDAGLRTTQSGRADE